MCLAAGNLMPRMLGGEEPGVSSKSHRQCEINSSLQTTMDSTVADAQSLTPAAIEAAYGLIQPHVHRTPLLTCKTLDTIASTPQSPEALVGTPFEGKSPAHPEFRFFFKCENFQRIGAFKARGAFHALLRLLEERGEEVKNRGVITHSSGISSSLKLS